MNRVHFLNVGEGDCIFIEHNSGRKSLIDISCGNIKVPDSLVKAFESLSGDQLQINAAKLAGNYRQKESPQNPIDFLSSFINNKTQESIWRFIISHPDMDHIDGIKKLFESYQIDNVWDTNNNKPDPDFKKQTKFLNDDWDFYKSVESKANDDNYRYLQLYSEINNPGEKWTEDDITILCPTKKIVKEANEKEDYNDLSYVLLYTPIKTGTKERWKIVFSGDSHNKSWEHIISNYEELVTDIDVLIAPHHGRDSERSYEFLKILCPTVTLFGNAKSKYIAYDKYKGIKITNNQANNIIFDCSNKIYFYVKNKKFADDYRTNKGWKESQKNGSLDAYFLYNIS